MTAFFHHYGLWIKLGVVVLVAPYLLWQVRKPHGWLGRRTLQAMNWRHADVTDWGLKRLSFRPDMTILDVGCGGGSTIGRLAALAPQGKVFGVDFSKTSVSASLATNADLVAAGRVEVRVSSVSKLPFEDATFDLVTAVETHYYWPHLVRDLAEVRRVLKPGGTLALIAELYRHGRGDLGNVISMKILRGSALTPEAHRAALVDAGFTDVEVVTQDDWICAIGHHASGSANA